MPLAALVDSLDKVPEAFRSEYVEREGKFVLQVENVLDVFAPGLVKKNNELLTEKKKAEQKALELEQKYAGIDLEEIQRLKDEKEDAEKEKATKDGNTQVLIDQQRKQFDVDTKKLNTQVETLTGANTTLTQELESLLITNEVLKAIEELDGNHEMLLPAVRVAGQVKVVVENGKRVVRIVNSDDVILPGDSMGNPMTVKQYIESEFKNKATWGGAFKPSGAGGSGATNGTARKMTGVDLSKLSPAERMKAYRRAESR